MSTRSRFLIMIMGVLAVFAVMFVATNANAQDPPDPPFVVECPEGYVAYEVHENVYACVPEGHPPLTPMPHPVPHPVPHPMPHPGCHGGGHYGGYTCTVGGSVMGPRGYIRWQPLQPVRNVFRAGYNALNFTGEVFGRRCNSGTCQ